MFGVILGYAVGVAMGAGCMAWHYAKVERVKREKDDEIRKLGEKLERMTYERDCYERLSEARDAFGKGREEGKHISAAQQLGETLGRRQGMVRVADTSKTAR